MATLVSRQMAVPFAIDSSGSVAFTTDPAQQLLDRVTAIIATDLGERLMRPEFGVPLRSSLFKAFADEDAILLLTELQGAINSYEAGVQITLIQPVLDTAGGALGITVSFTTTVAGQTGPPQSVLIPVGG